MQTSENILLRHHVQHALNNYFIQLGTGTAVNLYDLVLAEVEIPLLQSALERAKGNQTKAAVILGISRGTLRKKLKQYDLDGNAA